MASPPKSLNFNERVQLTAELAAPYRQLRFFVYLAAAASGGIGAFVFFFRALAGRDLNQTLPSLALQLGITAAALALWRWERQRQQRLETRVRERLQENQRS
jgi:hypothetical protein